ncbi:hypothetical protein [Sphingomonas montana]|uniref:hypothetical protein n=1 Tax=Sphingomonas montana TaxID=1843236 RepID=UPI00101AE748|nr:hypothetical protein [Sphingomonas montana]
MSSNIMLIGFVILAVGLSAYGLGWLRNRPAAMAFALGSATLALGLAIYTVTRDAPNGPPQELLDAADRAEAAQRH